jgi:peptidoglycan/xylan/chitin deacetylase (PgdA/CDA1 family)
LKLPSRPIVITFDDGYESTYTNAFPVLRKYGFHATVFMVSGFVGRHGFLTQQELITMQKTGLVDIESHTVDHKNLARLPQSQVMW